MPDATRYVPWAFQLAGTSIGMTNMRLFNDAQIDEIRSAMSLHPNLLQTIRKRPAIAATLLDPSQVTNWQAFGAGETITSVGAFWRALTQDAGPEGAYLSRVMASGVIMPVSLNAPVDQRATLDILALAHFTTGTAITRGTSSADAATVDKAYYPTHIIVGSDTIVAVRSINVNWAYQPISDDQLEPSYYVYEQYGLSGSAVVKDLSKESEARLEDGSEESVTALLTDANNGSNTVTVSLGNCKVMVEASDSDLTVNFTKLAA